MTKKEKEIREKVREELCSVREFDAFSYKGERYDYYVSDLKDNLIGENTMPDEHKEMFEKGSGSELKDSISPAKAKAIDSSSMLSYNFFRHVSTCPIIINDIEYNKVFFEVQLRTLNNSNMPANMDVVLVSKDKRSLLFIESKFLEYIDSDSIELGKSYKLIDSYYKDNSEKDDLHKMVLNFKNKRGHYNGGIKQNICHLIGISNLKHSRAAQEWFRKEHKNLAKLITNETDFKFLNIIFCPSNNEAKEKCENYVTDLKEFFEALPTSIKNYCYKTIINYRQLLEMSSVKQEIKDELIKRYINFHS